MMFDGVFPRNYGKFRLFKSMNSRNAAQQCNEGRGSLNIEKANGKADYDACWDSKTK